MEPYLPFRVGNASLSNLAIVKSVHIRVYVTREGDHTQFCITNFVSLAQLRGKILERNIWHIDDGPFVLHMSADRGISFGYIIQKFEDILSGDRIHVARDFAAADSSAVAPGLPAAIKENAAISPDPSPGALEHSLPLTIGSAEALPIAAGLEVTTTEADLLLRPISIDTYGASASSAAVPQSLVAGPAATDSGGCEPQPNCILGCQRFQRRCFSASGSPLPRSCQHSVRRDGVAEMERIILVADADRTESLNEYKDVVNPFLQGVFGDDFVGKNIPHMTDFTTGHMRNLIIVLRILADRHKSAWDGTDPARKGCRPSWPRPHMSRDCVFQLCGALPCRNEMGLESGLKLGPATNLADHHLRGVADLIGLLDITDKYTLKFMLDVVGTLDDDFAWRPEEVAALKRRCLLSDGHCPEEILHPLVTREVTAHIEAWLKCRLAFRSLVRALTPFAKSLLERHFGIRLCDHYLHLGGQTQMYMTEDNEWDMYGMCTMLDKQHDDVFQPLFDRCGAGPEGIQFRDTINTILSGHSDIGHAHVRIEYIEGVIAAVRSAVHMASQCDLKGAGAGDDHVADRLVPVNTWTTVLENCRREGKYLQALWAADISALDADSADALDANILKLSKSDTACVRLRLGVVSFERAIDARVKATCNREKESDCMCEVPAWLCGLLSKAEGQPDLKWATYMRPDNLWTVDDLCRVLLALIEEPTLRAGARNTMTLHNALEDAGTAGQLKNQLLEIQQTLTDCRHDRAFDANGVCNALVHMSRILTLLGETEGSDELLELIDATLVVPRGQLKSEGRKSNLALMLGDAFVGRNAEIQALHRQLAERSVLLVGHPGFGKSSLMGHICATAQKSDCCLGIGFTLAAMYAFYAEDGSTLKPEAFVDSLIKSLGHAFEEFKLLWKQHLRCVQEEDEKDVSAKGKLERALKVFDTIHPVRHGVLAVIIVDGLDEADRMRHSTIESSVVSLVVQLVDKCPCWVRVLATSRPIPEITAQLCCPDAYPTFRRTALISCPVNAVAANADAKLLVSQFMANSTELRDACRANDPSLKEDELYDLIARRSAGNFLYLNTLLQFGLRCVRPGKPLEASWYESYDGELGTLWHCIFTKEFPDSRAYRERFRPILGLLAAAFRPLSIDELCAATKRERDIGFLQDLGRLYVVLEEVIIGPDVHRWQLYHVAFKDWLTGRSEAHNFGVNKRESHLQLFREGLANEIRGLDAGSVLVELTFYYALVHYAQSHRGRRHGIKWSADELKLLEDAGRTASARLARPGELAAVAAFPLASKLCAEFAGLDVRETEYDETLLHICCVGGFIESLRVLLSSATVGQLNHANRALWTPLYAATRHGHTDCVKLLLKQDGIDVNFATADCSRTPLIAAACAGYVDIVRCLCERRDILVNAADKVGRTPFIAAACAGHVDIVQCLYERRDTLVNVADKMGWSPVFGAALHQDHRCLKYLLAQNDVDPNIRHHNGWTAASASARDGELEILDLLLQHTRIKVSVIVCRPNPTKLVPIERHVAGLRKLIEFLAQHPEQVDPQDVQRAREKARREGHDECALLLSKLASQSQGISGAVQAVTPLPVQPWRRPSESLRRRGPNLHAVGSSATADIDDWMKRRQHAGGTRGNQRGAHS